MQSVLNVRMDRALKERGDKILAENGISVSNAVRALWTQLVETRTLPDFLQTAQHANLQKQAKQDALAQLSSLSSSDERPLPDSASEDALYDELWARYTALS